MGERGETRIDGMERLVEQIGNRLVGVGEESVEQILSSAKSSLAQALPRGSFDHTTLQHVYRHDRYIISN